MYGVSNRYVCACFCIADHCTKYFAIVRNGGADVNDQPCAFFNFSYGEEQNQEYFVENILLVAGCVL